MRQLSFRPLLALLLLATSVHAVPQDKERMRLERDAARTVTPMEVPADAPRPPTTTLEKSKHADLKGIPSSRLIKDFETRLASLEQPAALVWGYLKGGAPSPLAVEQVERARGQLNELKAAEPSWRRLAEYEQRLAHIESGLAAGRALAAGQAIKKAEAITAAEGARDAAWNAKRVSDDGAHPQHAGAVVFAGKAVGAKDAVTPMTSTAIDAPLFARAFFKESGWNALHTAGVDCGATSTPAFKFNVYAKAPGSNDLTEIDVIKVDQATFQKATTLDLARKGSLSAGGTWTSDDEATSPYRWLTRVAAGLKPGDQPVDVEVRAWCAGSTEMTGFTIAKGTLTVKATAAGKEALLKKGRQKMQPSTHAAGAIAGQRTLVTRHFESKGFSVLDFRTASEWQTVKHPATGATLHRNANAFALLKKKDTGACELYSLVLQEPWNGSGFGPTLDFAQALSRPFVCTID